MTQTFEEKLISLILAETKGKTLRSGLPSGKVTEMVEAMGSQIGKFIAFQCGGEQEIMGKFLDGASQYIYEVAAENQQIGHFFGEMMKLRKTKP